MKRLVLTIASLIIIICSLWLVYLHYPFPTSEEIIKEEAIIKVPEQYKKSNIVKAKPAEIKLVYKNKDKQDCNKAGFLIQKTSFLDKIKASENFYNVQIPNYLYQKSQASYNNVWLVSNYIQYIPNNLLTSFINQGGTITIADRNNLLQILTNKGIDTSLLSEGNGYIQGVCIKTGEIYSIVYDDNEKSIADSLYHEFGHYCCAPLSLT